MTKGTIEAIHSPQAAAMTTLALMTAMHRLNQKELRIPLFKDCPDQDPTFPVAVRVRMDTENATIIVRLVHAGDPEEQLAPVETVILGEPEA